MRNIFCKLYQLTEKTLGGRNLEKYYLIHSMNKFIKSHLKKDFAIIDGHKMFLDSNDSLRLSINGVYEEFETEIVKKYVKSGDVVLDIGANIGYYTLILARLVGKKGKVFAFEPDPENFNILQRNVEINGYHNVVLLNKAVVNKTGKIYLSLSEENKGDHRIASSLSRKTIEIESIKLDDYFENDQNIDFIKMDIQGAEDAAIHGMIQLLTQNKEMKMLTEFSPNLLKECGVEPDQHLERLVKQGFKIFHINRKKRKMMDLDINNILKTYTPEKENFTYLFCIK